MVEISCSDMTKVQVASKLETLVENGRKIGV